ncbi:putative ankyrin repeat domain-containing protein 29-like [Fusarium austroafricanum]|uniref:Putative ankyrin repeat domain-containing protein 29-like n=1 Tax=Fusarium austroafricanum TaxID=2364996 RepID=A0A8H4K5J1_9HYPO|nr:putative ankyrin repeat domain-containing protein 29-like [Fusarium austroafricanum]
MAASFVFSSHPYLAVALDRHRYGIELFAGELESVSATPQPYDQAVLDLKTLRVQEELLMKDPNSLSEELKRSLYVQKYIDTMRRLSTGRKLEVPPIPPFHSLLFLEEDKQVRRHILSEVQVQAQNDRDMLGRSLLHLALDLGVGDDTAHLIRDATLTRDSWGRHPLHIACSTGHIDIVIGLIRRGMDLETFDNDGLRALHYASAAGQEDIVSLLADKAEIDPRDNTFRTPLFYSAQNGHTAVVRLLIEKGADIELEDDSGWTPLMHAIDNGRPGVVKLLLNEGASVDPLAESGKVMSSNLSERHIEVAKLLLGYGAAWELDLFCLGSVW